MRRGVLAISCLAFALSTPVHAQTRAPRIEIPQASEGLSTVRIAKWALLAAAAGLGVYALTNTAAADEAFDDLRALCTAAPQRCELSAAGRYHDPEAEGYFRRSADADRRARVGILGGQLTLLGSVALFVYDLRSGPDEPDNIPFPTPSGSPSRRVAVGIRLAY